MSGETEYIGRMAKRYSEKKEKRRDEQKDWRNLKEMLCKMHI